MRACVASSAPRRKLQRPHSRPCERASMTSDYTRSLAQFAVDLRHSDLPAAVVDRAKELALHAWGVQLAGSTLPWSQMAYRYVQSQGGAAQSTVVNYGLTTSTVNAAFVNGTFGHGFE